MARRSESRVLRPFINLSGLENIFKGVQLRVGDDFYPSGPVVIPQSNYQQQSYSLKMNFKIEDLRREVETTGVPFVDTALVLVSRGRTLRTVNIQFIHHLRNSKLEDEIEFELSGENRELLFRDRRGFISTFALVLSRTLNEEPLKPFLTGTWLARTKFIVGPQIDLTSIAPQELTKEIREKEKLGERTLFYVKFNETLMDETNIFDAMQIYLDENVLKMLQNDPFSEISHAYQAQFAVEVIFQTILQVSNNLQEESGQESGFLDLPEGSGVQSFIEKISDTLQIAEVDLFKRFRQNPSHFHAMIQHSLNLQKIIDKSLRETIV